MGHVIRSLALAEMLADDFECHFIIRKPLPSLKKQIQAICQSVIELPETADNIKEANQLAINLLDGKKILVLDGYHFKTAYQRALKKTGCKIVCIDDIHAYHFVADAVINHAGGLTPYHYSAEKYTQFYLGLQYALLRKPFREAAKNRNYENKEDATFICMGGADPKNDTLQVLKLCEKIDGIKKCYVIIGSAYRYSEELDSFALNTNLDLKILSSLSAEEMVVCMRRCNRAITSPSSISYEYLSTGGELYLHLTADNQKGIYEYFINSPLAFPFEEFSVQNPSRIEKAMLLQQKLLDGESDKRFGDLFKNLSAASN